MTQVEEPETVQRSRLSRLYHGDVRVDVVGRRRWWFLLSALLLLVGAGSLLVRGLNLGIEFEGGVVWEVPAGEASVADARDAIAPYGLEGATIQEVESDGRTELRIATDRVEETDQVTAILEEVTGEPLTSFEEVGPTWGEQITEKARNALVVFLALVSIYIGIRFKLKSAVPAMLALVHDVVITVGVYAIGQFPVTPATVIAFLTILGYSLYDTIVVFDKVDENRSLVTANGNLTFGAMVNLSLNQTLMRSINTTITSLLPVGSLLIIGAWIMGAATLQEFALALLVGLIAGTYSSFFVAAPLLSLLREREPQHRKIHERVVEQGLDPTAVPDRVSAMISAGRGVGRGGPAPAGKPAGSTNGGAATTTTPSGRVIPARPRKKRSRR